MKLLKLTLRGPKWLQNTFRQIEAAVNERTPQAGFGNKASENKDGVMIHAEAGASGSLNATPETIGGTGASGTASNIYGSLNGQPAVFHLSQTADPELVT